MNKLTANDILTENANRRGSGWKLINEGHAARIAQLINRETQCCSAIDSMRTLDERESAWIREAKGNPVGGIILTMLAQVLLSMAIKRLIRWAWTRHFTTQAGGVTTPN